MDKTKVKPKISAYSLSRSIVTLITVLVVLSIGAMTMIAHNMFTQNLTDIENNNLQHETETTGNLFSSYIEKLENDVIYLSWVAPIQGIIRAKNNNNHDPIDQSTYQQWVKRLIIIFSRMLEANEDYLQIRFIEFKNDGQELIRVDQDNGNIIVIAKNQLQKKGNTNYVKETAKLSTGRIYNSDITYNREHGKISKPHTPVLRSSTPIYSETGELFGMVVINQDMRAVFEALKKNAYFEHQLFITNKEGDFLVHPNKRHELSFEFNRPHKLDNEFPHLKIIQDEHNHQIVIENDNQQENLLVNYSWKKLGSHSKNHVGIIVTSQLGSVISAANKNNQQLIIAGLGITVLTLILGWLYSFSITAPLKKISESIKTYSDGKLLSELPVNAKGEIGYLARSFNNLISDINDNVKQLRHKTETVEQTSQHLTAILETAVDAIIGIEPDGTIQTLNPAAETIFGYQADELIGNNVKMLMPSPYHEEHDGYLSNYLGTGNKKVIGIGREVTGRRKDGSTFPMELSVSEVVVGNERSFTGIVRDISERKTAEEELRQKTESLEQSSNYVTGILETAVDAIIGIEANGTIMTLNPAAETIFGYKTDELVGKNVKMLMPAPYHEEHDGYLKNYLNSGEKKVIGIGREVTGRRKDGSTFPMELSVSEVLVGSKRSFTGIVRDISERKAAEDEIVAAKEQAEIANTTKSEFLATMSHEIRTPMNGILGMSQLLLETKLNNEQQDYVNSIKSSGDSLLTIINDILDFSKIEAGKLIIEPIPFDLKATLFDMVDLLTVYTKGKELELILHFPNDIQPEFIGDPGRIRQILMNLTSNAIKFTEQGHVLIDVKKAHHGNHEMTLRFSVQDTGKGINEEAQKRLFNAFTQADASTTRKYGGTGLGLAISKRLVEIMGGSIGLKSKPDEGSTFWFDLTLPITNEKIESVPDIPKKLNGLSVLIVDDNELNRNIYTEYLNSWNVESTAVASADEALSSLQNAQLEHKPFQVVLSDLNMPNMNGEELANSIISNPNIDTPKIILLTSSPERGDNERFTTIGVSGYLVKPIDPSILMDSLIQIIHRDDHDEGTPQLITRHSIYETKEKKKIDNRIDFSAKKLRTLIAEDNIVNQKVASKILNKMNCTVDIAANGKEAVEMAKQFSYDLIFMDCQMPEMDGYEATGLIKKYLKLNNINTPIIAMTANAIKGDRELCLAAGMDDYLSKPIDQKKLLSIIKKWSNETNTQDIAI